VIAKNAREAIEKAVKREKETGTNLHNIVGVRLIGQED
jgi:hypothetical protein